MAISTLSSPGVEVKELDNSLRVSSTTGTTIYIPGFAAQGPTDEVNSIGSIEDFELLYGTPTTPAECYFYYTVAAVLENSGPGTNVLVYRLAYGDNEGDNIAEEYTALVYPAIPVKYLKREYLNGENKWWPVGSLYTTQECEGKVISESDSEDGTTDTKVIGEAISFNAFIINPENDTDTSKKPEFTNIEFKYNSTDKIWVGTLLKGATEVGTVHFTDAKYYTRGTCVLTATTDSSYVMAFDFNSVLGTTISEASESDTIVVTLKKKISWETDEISIADSYVPADGYDITYLIGAPVTHQLSLNDYYRLLTGELFTNSKGENAWDESPMDKDGNLADLTKLENISHAAFITLNIARNIIDDTYQGYYIGITDNYFNIADDALYYGEKNSRFNCIQSVKFTSKFDTTERLGHGINDYQYINQNRLGFYLDQDYTGSISRVMQVELNKFDTTSELYDDTVNIGIFRLSKSTSNTNVLSLNYNIAESYNAAFGKKRVQSVGTSTYTKSYFLESETSSSFLMSVLVNPNISENIFVDTDNILHGKVRVYGNKLISGLKLAAKKYLSTTASTSDTTRSAKIYTGLKSYTNVVNRLGITKKFMEVIDARVAATTDWLTNESFENSSIYGFGKFTTVKNSRKIIGSVPAKLKRALKYVSNDEIYPDLDIVLEGGLGTVYAYANLNDSAETEGEFTDAVAYAPIEDLRTGRNTITEDAESVKQDYMDVQNTFMAFANSFQNGGRGDTFYIADVLRGILIKGKNTKVSQLFGSTLVNTIYAESDGISHSWTTSVYHPINHLLDSFTTSYASVYAQWFKISDAYSGDKIWVPSCGYVAALMARTDANYGPWYAAAGYNRGVVPGVLDCAINPDQPQRDDLYKICVNSIPKIGNIGYTIWGIRTMSKRASCFDQNTCRRTFLHMEKTIKRYLRYYVFEPNNAYTQVSIFNDIDPYLEGIKNRGGIYSYTLVCDDTVNTDEIVNDGEMVVRCEAAPTRTAEKIVLEMVANRKNSTVNAV